MSRISAASSPPAPGEAGVSRATILAAMAHHGVAAIPHATKRHQAAQRDQAIARALGFESLAAYVAQRRARDIIWKALVAESGVPETTLRRHHRAETHRPSRCGDA